MLYHYCLTHKRRRLNILKNKCIHFFGMANQKKIKPKTLIQNYKKGGLKMIDLDKFIQAQKISRIKRLFEPNIKTTLKEVYTQRLSKFGNALLFECSFNENDISKIFKENSFFTNVLYAWSKIHKQDVIIDYSNEIIWNNSNIYVGNRTIFYKKVH